MSHFETSDRTRLFYRDWGSGQPIVFVSSWALESRAWARHILYHTHFERLMADILTFVRETPGAWRTRAPCTQAAA